MDKAIPPFKLCSCVRKTEDVKEEYMINFSFPRLNGLPTTKNGLPHCGSTFTEIYPGYWARNCLLCLGTGREMFVQHYK